MQAKIIRIGNSRGVVLPKVLLEQARITDRVNLMLRRGKIVVEPIGRHPREGWEFPGGKEPLSEEDRDWLDAPLETPLGDDGRK